jgi:hypothetical protein
MRKFGRPTRRLENNIKTNRKETGYEFVNWIHLAHIEAELWDVLKAVMALGVPKRKGNFLTR